jgi:hypothetical protein
MTSERVDTFVDAYFGRGVNSVLREGGARIIDVKTVTMDYLYPFTTDLATYVTRAFLDYRAEYERLMSPSAFCAMVEALELSSENSIWRSPDSHILLLETAVVAGASG